jgi:phenylacetate-CoA ligase
MRSPLWAQQLAVAAYGWRWYRRRFSKHFHELVREFKSREYWTAQQFQDYQEAQLDRIFKAAWNSPYYQRVFQEARITPETPPPEALKSLPTLSKEMVRTRAKDLLTRTVPGGTLIQRSSGTTGTPTDIYYTQRFHALELAVPEARNLNWAGVTYKDRRVMFGVRKVCSFQQSRSPFWRFSPAEDMAYASIYHLSQEFMPEYIKFLRQYRPAVVMGYPSALNILARFALETGILPAPAKAVFTTSETVTEQLRSVIEEVWKCKVYDRYGAVEGCMFASQCEHGRYHVSPEVGIIEIIDHNDMPCPPGSIGEVICTGLQNTLQPLIRYRIGDVARWAEDQDCSCGRQMPILEAVEGRFEDICYTPDGRQMLRFDTVFKGVGSIKEAQVVQESVQRFVVRVVPSDHFTNHDVARIEQNMTKHVGNVQVVVVAVPNIERSVSGKFRAVICKLSPVEIAAVRAGYHSAENATTTLGNHPKEAERS